MEFVTLHQLARELDTPEKNLRYLFRNLRRANKLKENDDFIKDDYRDDRHFTYKINPVTFTRAAGLSPAPPSGAAVGINGYQDGYQTGINIDTKNETLGTKLDNHNDEIDTKLDTKPPDPILNQDLIDILKDQLRVKDEQLERSFEQSKSQRDQIDSLQSINNMTMGEIIKLNQQLRLSSGIQRDTNDYQHGYQTRNSWYQAW